MFCSKKCIEIELKFEIFLICMRDENKIYVIWN